MRRRSPPAEIFAVEDTAVQVAFPHLAAGRWTLEGAGRVRELEVTRAGPVLAALDQLPPASELEILLSGSHRPRAPVATVTTLAAPPGRQLGRIATVSDLHLGSFAFGVRNTIRERRPPGVPPFPWRCASAALREALDWGAEAIVVKGDLTATGYPSQLRAVGGLLADVPVPVHVLLGNHEMRRQGPDPWAVLAESGIDAVRDVRSVDAAGTRLVLGHTPAPRSGRGTLSRAVKDGIVAGAAAGRPGALVFLHHYLQPYPWPTFYPVSIPSPSANSLLRRLREAQPNVLVSTGHSHRNRHHVRHGVTVTEVASTLHYPGVWAGYAIHEGGVRQVVRRIAEPTAVSWLERTKRAAGGLWGRWAPGQLEDRCFSLDWTSSPD